MEPWAVLEELRVAYKHLEARHLQLKSELNLRGNALYWHAAREVELEATVKGLQKIIAKREQQIAHLKQVERSAKRWQEGSWLKRAFRRWNAPQWSGAKVQQLSSSPPSH